MDSNPVPTGRMPCSGTWCRVVFVTTDVSEELIASLSRVIRNGQLGKTFAINSNWITLRRNTLQLLVTANVVPSSLILLTLMMEAMSFSETSVLIPLTWHRIPDDSIPHSHYNETLKSYTAMTCTNCLNLNINPIFELKKSLELKFWYTL
jgi:hypothetical protein